MRGPRHGDDPGRERRPPKWLDGRDVHVLATLRELEPAYPIEIARELPLGAAYVNERCRLLVAYGFATVDDDSYRITGSGRRYLAGDPPPEQVALDRD